MLGGDGMWNAECSSSHLRTATTSINQRRPCSWESVSHPPTSALTILLPMRVCPRILPIHSMLAVDWTM